MNIDSAEPLGIAMSPLRKWAADLQRADCPIPPDEYVPNTWSEARPAPLETALQAATADASALAGLPLHPVCSFLRRYEHGAELRRHVDREAIEWTASLVLHHDGPTWPLRTVAADFDAQAVFLRSGAIEHWRDRFTGRVSVVGLLHWNSDPRYLDDRPPPPYAHASQVLSGDDIAKLYADFDASSLKPGMIGHAGVPSQNRANMIAWLRRPRWQWLYDRIYAAAARANAAHWGLDIAGRSTDDVQFTRYEVGEHYGWHRDVDENARGQTRLRTLSVVLLLRSSEAGGGLELRRGGVIPMVPGDAAIFPSAEEHRAIEVVKGTRDSVVLWLSRSP